MAEAVNKVTYTKEQIIGSKKYAGRADLLSALLEPGKSYTLELKGIGLPIRERNQFPLKII